MDFDRLDEIRCEVDVPLVLHGASGVSDESIIQSIERGICKVNYATELRVAFTSAVKRVIETNPDTLDPKKYNAVGRDEVKKIGKG